MRINKHHSKKPLASQQSLSESSRSVLLKILNKELSKTSSTEKELQERNFNIVEALMFHYNKETGSYNYTEDFALDVYTELAKPLDKGLLKQIKSSEPLQAFLLRLPINLRDFKSMINIDGEFDFTVFNSSEDFKILLLTRGYKSESRSCGYHYAAPDGNSILGSDEKILVSGHSHPPSGRSRGTFSEGDKDTFSNGTRAEEEFVVCLQQGQLDLSTAESYNGRCFSTSYQGDTDSVPILQKFGILN